MEKGNIFVEAFNDSLLSALEEIRELERDFFLPGEAYFVLVRHLASEQFKRNFELRFFVFGTKNTGVNRIALLEEKIRFLTALKIRITDLCIWEKKTEAEELISCIDRSLNSHIETLKERSE